MPYLELDLDSTGHGKVLLDGVDQRFTTGLDIKIRVGHPVEVTLHRVADDIAGRVEAEEVHDGRS